MRALSRLKRLRSSLGMGLAIGLLGILASLLPGFSEIEEDFELAWLFHARGSAAPPSDVVVVALDARAAQALDMPGKPSEWPRGVHARLVDRLARAGARVICFDLTFDTNSRDQENDVAFAQAMSRAANVILVDSLRGRPPGQERESKGAIGDIHIEEVLAPIPALEQAAVAHAPFPLPKESRVDTYWTFKSGAGDNPTLPVVALQLFAFDAYREFVPLLRSAEPSLALTVPASARELLAAAGGGGLIEAIREAFRRDPDLPERVLGQLRRRGEGGISAVDVHLIRSLVGAYRSNESAYLNYYGPARSITTIPYHVALGANDARLEDGGTDSDPRFRGKAVFVGFSASSQPEQDRIRDDYRTVFSGASGLDISGVEIAATAFANLLEDRPVRPVPLQARLAIFGLLGFVLGTACRLLRPAPAAALVVALSSAYAFAAVREFGVSGAWLPLLVPLGAQAPLAFFAGALLQYREARRERKRLKEAFGRFVPDKIVDRLIESVGTTGAADQVVYGACLATDLEKYTLLAETMSPRELATLMNEYYAELFKPIERLEGVVNEVVGDAMLAIWAAPIESRAVRQQACDAALEIYEALERFNLARTGKPPLKTRFGLHSGQLLLGSIGASKHYEYQAVGDMVNTSSRIEGLSKYLGTRILASESVVEGLTGFLTRPIGSFVLAGKSAAIPVVELGGRVADADPRISMRYQRFALALAAYRARRWREAAQAFKEILDAFPDDGPSRFFLRLVQTYTRKPPAASWDGAIRLEHK